MLKIDEAWNREMPAILCGTIRWAFDKGWNAAINSAIAAIAPIKSVIGCFEVCGGTMSSSTVEDSIRFLRQAVAIIETQPPQADNTGSPKLPPCEWCDSSGAEHQMAKYFHFTYCPNCGRQLRAGA